MARKDMLLSDIKKIEREKFVFDSLKAVFGDLGIAASPHRFPNGGHYKIELVGPNSPATFERLLHVARRADVPVHRVVGTLGGFDKLSDADLRGIAAISEASGVEFVATPLMPLTNVESAGTSEGSYFGIHLRGVESVEMYLEQFLRGVDCGLRSFLIWDTAALQCVEYMKSQHMLPRDVYCKVSIFAGSSHTVDCWNWIERGAHSVASINPVVLGPYEYGVLRNLMGQSVPFDIHFTTLDSMGGLDRICQAYDIIRHAAPVYVKIERGARVADMMNERKLFDSVIPKVMNSAKKFLAEIHKHPDIIMVPVKK